MSGNPVVNRRLLLEAATALVRGTQPTAADIARTVAALSCVIEDLTDQPCRLQLVVPGEVTDEQRAIEHGRYLASSADRFLDTLNKAYNPETEETDLGSDEVSDSRHALANSVHEFRKRADRAMPLPRDVEGR
ncbi:hypothetical protein BJP27_24510 (plasmid) [Pseudomonas oryzihabitans]|nr:hypothetical protein BJP27_23860 [Pseudomonas psychrotolerans]APQ14735.1 hypothetical protein BJP27_24510 [Pseudomonas psychrotolerans]